MFEGLLTKRTRDDMYGLAESPQRFGQVDIRRHFGVGPEHYMSGAPGKKLVIGFYGGWPVGEVRREASDTQLQTCR